MANSSENNNELNSPPTEEVSPIQEDKKTNPRPRNLNKLTFLLALIALIITGYSYYNNFNTNSQLAQENKGLNAQFQQLKDAQNNLQGELGKQHSLYEQNQRELNNKIDAFSQQASTAAPMNNPSQDWLLLKARYYLELAQINAHWVNNSDDQSSLALLQEADITLGQINKPELFKIRQIIAQEMLTLKSLKPIDKSGLLSQLDAIQSEIDNLHIQESTSSSNTNPIDSTQTITPLVSTSSSWKTKLVASMNKLGALVVIRRNDEEIKPLLSPEFESLLKENLRLNIQEAQWAILNQNQVAYQLAIKQAINTLQRGLNKQLLNSNTLIEQLNNLKQINLITEPIELGKALPLINELIEQKPFAKSESNNQAGGSGE